MDLEGYEFEVIKGMLNTLERLKPRLIFTELHPNTTKDRISKFFDVLISFNYEIEWCVPRVLVDGMLEASDGLLVEVCRFLQGFLPKRNLTIPPPEAIPIEKFIHRFLTERTIYHVIFQKKVLS